jgi:transcriptional regulator with XRE-family HTH domain
MIMTSYRKNFGKILKEQRQFSKLTLHELSDASGVSPSHLGRIEKGERFPSAVILRRIAKPLGLSEDEIFIQAGYLSPDFSEETRKGSSHFHNSLDPEVARVLSQEPVEVQRAMLGMLTTFKILAANLPPPPGFTTGKLNRTC